MTIESGIIFGDFATLPSPVRAIRIVGRGKGMSGAKLRKKANRPTGRRHGCGHSRLPFASTRFRGHVSHSEPAAYRRIRSEDRRRDGPRGVPHESGLRALSVLLMAACCILGALRGGSHEPAVDCKARHGRISEKERLSRSRSETMPVLRTILLSGCSADAANGFFYGIPLREMRSDFSESSGERRPWHAKDGCSGFVSLSRSLLSLRPAIARR